MYIDVHAHLNNEKLFVNVDEVIQRAKNSRVEMIVNASYDFESMQKSIELSQKYENVYATLGVHPHACFEFDDQSMELIKQNAKNLKVLGIGEIGLDYYDLETQIAYIKEHNPNIENLTEEKVKQKQKEIFIKQIDLASELNLPIIVHSRDATNDTLQIIKENKNKLKLAGLIHCFSGSVETAKEYFKLGFYISVGGSVTFKNARNIPDVIKELGIDRVVLETDCPYLTPEPYRGKTNEPKNVVYVADKIAELMDISYLEVEDKTTENAHKLFGRLPC